MPECSSHSPKTLDYYEYSLGKFEKWLIGAGITQVQEVTPTNLRQFMLDIEPGLKPNSVHGILRAVRAFYSFLRFEELIDFNPMSKVKMPKVDKTIMPPFTDLEIKTIMKTTDGKDNYSVRNKAIVMLLLDSGIRLSECASLKVGDIDLVNGMFKVLGKGRKERMSKIGMQTLKAFTKYSRLRGGLEGEPLWIGKYGTMTSAGIAEVLEKLGKSIGVHVHPHKFRRTCALFMLRNGADVFSIQNLLGHADLAILRRYVAQNDRDIAESHQMFSVIDRI